MEVASPGDLSTYVAPRVLVVDDDLMNITVFEALLLELGKTCDTALSGEAAIVRIENRLAQVREGKGQVYDLILLDYSMPDKDGPETCQVIRRLCHEAGVKQPYICCCSAYGSSKVV